MIGPQDQPVTDPNPRFLDGPSMQALAALNERAREIFRQIVESYLTTGEPVGSRNLARILPMALSPASIRNVMADLEHSGLIFAPHTSAGPAPDRARPALFRRRHAGTRRRQPGRAGPDRGADASRGLGPHLRLGVGRGLDHAVGCLARRRRGSDHQSEREPEAYRIRAPRPGPGARRAGLGRRLRGEPPGRPAARPAHRRTAGGDQLPERAASRPKPSAPCGPRSRPAARR